VIGFGQWTSPHRQLRRRFSSTALPVCLLILAAGCRLLSNASIQPALSYREQVREVQRLVPLGTQRDETIARLEAAGIVGEYSAAGQSIYHCQFRTLPDGGRRHMNVALLFNEQDEFYAVQPSDSNVIIDRVSRQHHEEPRSTAGPHQPGNDRSSQGRSLHAIPWPAEGESSGNRDPSSNRDSSGAGGLSRATQDGLRSGVRAGRRFPFGDPEGN